MFSHTLPPGPYVIGDPSYLLSDAMYRDFVARSIKVATKTAATVLKINNGVPVGYISTAGDGLFRSRLSSKTYAADSGMLSIIPEVLVHRPIKPRIRSKVRAHTFSQSVHFSKTKTLIRILDGTDPVELISLD